MIRTSKLFPVLVVILTVLPSPNAMKTTKSYMEIAPRIISGQPTTIQTHRHLVRVYAEHIETIDNQPERVPFYGHGALLTLKWTLTAAHCVYGASVSSLIVIGGVTTRDEVYAESANVQMQGVCSVFIHPSWGGLGSDEAKAYLNDLALLKHRGAFRESRTVRGLGVDAIPYFYNEADIYTQFSVCTVAGLGDVDDSGVELNQLQEARVSLLPSHACVQRNIIHPPTKATVCTHDANSAAYEGDSGTPLICGHACLIGILSAGRFNTSTPKTDRVNIFTRVDHWKGWVVDTINYN